MGYIAMQHFSGEPEGRFSAAAAVSGGRRKPGLESVADLTSHSLHLLFFTDIDMGHRDDQFVWKYFESV